MNSSSKKHKDVVECTGQIQRDRLSDLPDGVLVHILSFLPTRDAVKTMLLRRFGNLWTLVPSLKFDDGDWEYDSDDDTPQYSHFTKFIHNALILHRRPTIDKFGLRIDWALYDDAFTKIELEACLRFVLSRQAKKLMIQLDTDNDEPLFVPTCIFTSQCLVTLALYYCTIQVPSKVHMGSLRSLVLDNVVVEEGDLYEFASGCPVLQELDLRYVRGDGVETVSFSNSCIVRLKIVDSQPYEPWTINCPNLKILEFFVCFRDVGAINVPSVIELSTGLPMSYCDEEDAHRLKLFLERFQSLEVLKLKETDVHVMQCTYNLLANVGFPQNRWKRVVLESSLQHTNNIAGVCSLVRNSPCLEELIIHVESNIGFCLGLDIDVVSQEARFPCVAPHLKVVSMHGYANPYDCQLRLVDFLLNSAVNLEELVIAPTNKRFFRKRGGLTSAEEQIFVKRLSKFSRASRKATILCKSDYNNGIGGLSLDTLGGETHSPL